MPFQRSIQLIRTGDPVAPGTDNPVFSTIIANVNYLYDLIQQASFGSTVIARQVTVESGAEVGHAVYFNALTSQFERGLATASTDPTTGAFVPGASAKIWGVVFEKTNTTLADVLLFGYAPLDLSAAINGDVEAGDYYLSSTAAGFLTAQRLPVAVPVLRADGAGNVFVFPAFIDFLDRHTHYRFALATQPAGDTSPPAINDPHVITNADSGAIGWLPADDPSFDGLAPSGAVFGYNLAAEPALQRAWPPLPLESATLEWNKGLDKSIAGTSVPIGPQGLVVLDRNGIWWMSDCYGDVPWPIDLDTTAPTSLSGVGECPRDLYMELILWFMRPNFTTEATTVTSLRSNDSRLIVRCVDNTAASTGDLEILLDLNFALDTDQTTRGGIVLKGLNDTGRFTRGPVVEGIYAVSGNITLTNGSAFPLVNLDPDDEDSPLLYRGPVGITVSPSETFTLPVQEVRLDGATLEDLDGVLYIGFLNGEQSSYRALFEVPTDLALTSPQMQIKLFILGAIAGSLPALEVTARIIPRPTDGLTTPMDLPDSGDEFSVTITTVATLTDTYQYVEATSDAFAIAPGDVVFFTVRRLVDGYAGQVGILSQQALLSGS